MSNNLIFKKIYLDLQLDEAQRLEMYCQQTGKTEIDAIHELIHRLPDDPNNLEADLIKTPDSRVKFS